MTKFRFDHIHVFTSDPEGTAAYYERMFGAEVIRSTQQGRPRIDLRLGGANIFIMDVSQNPQAAAHPGHPHHGLDHFGLEVESIDAVCAALKAKGANFTLEPTTVRPGVRIAFIAGPDNVSIELLERLPVTDGHQ
jgi:catechol 2,3-dioxygenase-like lactoylglutathione lyase family enzyme